MKEERQPFRSEKEASEIIRCFEKAHRPFSYAVNNVSVWQILRYSIASDLQNMPFKRTPLPRHILIKHSLIGVIDLIKLIIKPKKANYLVSTCVSLLRLRQAEGYRDIFFDTLLSKVNGGFKMQFVNTSGYDFQQTHAFIKPNIDSSLIYLIIRILIRLFPVRNDKGVFHSVAELINKELGLANYTENVIRRIYSSFWWQSQLYVLLLKLLKPNVVFAADTGELALLLACREQGIVFVELQHGIQTPDHPSTIPTVALEYEDKLLLPNFWGVFGDFWKNRLVDSIMAYKGRIHSVGTEMIDMYREYRARHFYSNSLCPVLTLTTQGLDTENLINFVREFLQIYKGKCMLNIKLHPAFDNSMKLYVDALGNDSRCRIISGKSEPNTYELLSCSDLHLSIASACHYDALGLGIPTVVLGLMGHQLIDDLVAKGDALIVMTPHELSSIVQSHKWQSVSNETSENYYKRNFIANVQTVTGL